VTARLIQTTADLSGGIAAALGLSR